MCSRKEVSAQLPFLMAFHIVSVLTENTRTSNILTHPCFSSGIRAQQSFTEAKQVVQSRRKQCGHEHSGKVTKNIFGGTSALAGQTRGRKGEEESSTVGL